MSKYDFELDLTSQNSLSKIVGRIKPGSAILEFGPAEGRLTRYLSENMDCQVTVIEIDQDAYRKARSYAVDGICANAEEDSWVRYLDGKKYDYIIFADVLEHLKKPDRVLKNTLQFLKEEGSILTSIPNIAHNKILVKLYENRFDYTDVGLLDDTHIKFWGYKNLEPFFDEIGYKIVYEDIVCDMGWGGDQAVRPDRIDGQLLSSLNHRYLGIAYQFVLELKEKQYCRKNQIEKVTGEDLYQAECLRIHAFYDYGDDFKGESCQELLARRYGKNGLYLAEIPIDKGAIRARFDPVEGEKIYCRILMATDEFGNSCDVYPANAYSYEGLDVFDNTDPQYIINVDYESVKSVTVAFALEFVSDQRIGQFRQLLSINAEIGRVKEENHTVQSQNEELTRVRLVHENIISELNDNLLHTRQSYEKVVSDLNHNFLNEKQSYEKVISDLNHNFLNEKQSYEKVISDLNHDFLNEKQQYEKIISELENQLDLARRAENFRDRIILDLNIKAEKVNRDTLLKEKEHENIRKNNQKLQEELEQYKEKFEQIANSSIWRISEPLRNCMDKMRKPKQENSQDSVANLTVSEGACVQECLKKQSQMEEEYEGGNDDYSEDDVGNVIVPLVSAFIQQVAKRTDDKLIFLSERGKFLQKIYQTYCQSAGIIEIPNTVVDITQESMEFSLIEEVADIRALLKITYEGQLSKLLRERFRVEEPMLSADGVVRLPDDEEKVLAAIGINAEAFLDKIAGTRKEYKEYLERCLSTEAETFSMKITVVDLTCSEWFCHGARKILGKECETYSIEEFYKGFSGIVSEKNFEDIQMGFEIIMTNCNDDSPEARETIREFIS